MAPKVQVTMAPIRPSEDFGPISLDRLRSAGDARNGLPELVPYRWRPGEAERDAEVQARIAAAKAMARSAVKR